MIQLGDRVKDEVTGFKGIAVALTIYLDGCDRISVQPPVDKDGKKLSWESFDEPRLVVLEAAVVKRGSNETGGPEKYIPRDRD